MSLFHAAVIGQSAMILHSHRVGPFVMTLFGNREREGKSEFPRWVTNDPRRNYAGFRLG